MSRDRAPEWDSYYAVDERGHRLIELAAGLWIMRGDSFGSCLVTPEQNFGTYRIREGWMYLTAKYDDDFVPDRLKILDWGGRRYLLLAEEGERFESAVNEGQEPRFTLEGSFLLRLHDCDIEVSSPPDL